VVALLGATAVQADESSRALARSLFQETIEINTTGSVGTVAPAAEAMAKQGR